LSAQNDGKPVDAVDVETTWESLVSRSGAQLIDVRTRAEWTYVGIPDLGAIGKRAVLVEWQTFPDQTVDPRFVERLAGELKVIGAQLNDDLFFICRSGGRLGGIGDMICWRGGLRARLARMCQRERRRLRSSPMLKACGSHFRNRCRPLAWRDQEWSPD
jgi:rhodanese-related sulfurtransferase